jgi:hypothetical protein
MERHKGYYKEGKKITKKAGDKKEGANHSM